jgi:hypothetical protein
MLRRRWLGLALASGTLAAVACGGSPTARPPGNDGGSPDGAAGDSAPTDGEPSPDGGTDRALPDDAGHPPGGFAPVDGVGPGGLARRVGMAHYTVGEALLSGGDGTGWLFWRTYADPDFSGQVTHLDNFDARGVVVRESPLGAAHPDGVVLHGDGALTSYHNRCGPAQTDTCFHRDDHTGPITDATWPTSSRSVTRYLLDNDGSVVGSADASFADRNLPAAVGDGDGLYALTHHGSYVLHRLDRSYTSLWSAEVMPAVIPPPVAPDAPIEELLRSFDLAQQLATPPVAVADGVVVAATVARGTLAALSMARGTGFTLPADPRCPDVLVVHIPSDRTRAARYFSVPTAGCERLPKLAVVDNHAIVATILPVAKPPAPNDTSQYDIGLAIVNLATGQPVSRTLALEEDDVVYAVAACGPGRACLAGLTGSTAVDTGSTVTFADGFVLPVSLAGEPGTPWILTSPRHSEIRDLVPRPGGLLFFATVNGPITHTADGDPWLGFNEGMLGTIDGPP